MTEAIKTNIEETNLMFFFHLNKKSKEMNVMTIITKNSTLSFLPAIEYAIAKIEKGPGRHMVLNGLQSLTDQVAIDHVCLIWAILRLAKSDEERTFLKDVTDILIKQA